MSQLIEKYYRETDAKKRRKLLDESIALGEEPRENEIRREIWEIRYREPSAHTPSKRADGYIGLWMSMEYHSGMLPGIFGSGVRRAQKEIKKQLSLLQIPDYIAKGGIYEEILYRELVHLVRTYIVLCQTDKNYNSAILGLGRISEEHSKNKLKGDVRNIALFFPQDAHLTEELALLTKAAYEAYDELFPDEGGLDAQDEDE